MEKAHRLVCLRVLRVEEIAVWDEWGGRQVRVPWPSDGVDVSYSGTVVGVVRRATCLRVRLHEKAGWKVALGSASVWWTVPIDDCIPVV